VLKSCPGYIYLATTLILLYLLVVQDAQAQVSVDVWTNKGGRGQGSLDGGTYTIGEYILICFSLNANVDRLKFHIITPDGRDIVYHDGRINAGTYCLEGVERGPVGVNRVIVEAWIGGNLVAADEVRYNVVECPTHTLYLGLRITVKEDGSDELIVIEGWIRPEGISWDVFKSQCYNALPGPSYYHVNYIRDLLVRPSLNAASLTEVGRGIDDSARIVWTRFTTRFSSLGYSDGELKILRIVDSIKGRGGFIDEVRVESPTRFWRATPTPTTTTNNYVEWMNTRESAPDRYEIYLYPVATLRLRVEGIPQGRTLDVIIDGKKVGTVSATQTFEKKMLGLEHELNVSPNILEGESKDVRHVCINCPYHVVADEFTGLAEVSLIFKKEYRIIIDSEPRVTGLTIDGRTLAPSELPYESWWLEGTQHLVKLLQREVLSSLSENTRKVYRFRAWSDGETREERIINVNSPITIKSIYYMQTQYKVTVSTPYGTAFGVCQNMAGSTLWCDEREVLLLKVDFPVYIAEGKRANLTGWIIDGKPTSQFTVLVDSPKDIKAVWKIQYFVDIDKAFAKADVVGAGWYDEGDVARIIVKEALIYVSDDTRYVFDGWEGSCMGLDCGKKEITVTVSKPLSFRAKWYPEYRIKVAPMEASPATNCPEWVKGGSVCMFSSPSELPSQQSADTKYRFVKWVVSSGGVTLQEGRDTKMAVGVDKPITATAYYEPWHRILISGGPASPVISGCMLEGSDAWCREGSLVTIDLPTTSVGFLITQEFKGWVIKTVSGESMSEYKSITFHIVGPVKLTAMWTPNYTQLIFTSAATLTASTLYLFMNRKWLVRKIGGRPVFRPSRRPSPETLSPPLQPPEPAASESMQTTSPIQPQQAPTPAAAPVDEYVANLVKRYYTLLASLESSYREGKISPEVYVRLKTEYVNKLRQLGHEPTNI
jgi:uncharacterized repeat protein (TIGR02543 family)